MCASNDICISSENRSQPLCAYAADVRTDGVRAHVDMLELPAEAQSNDASLFSLAAVGVGLQNMEDAIVKNSNLRAGESNQSIEDLCSREW